MNRSFSDLKHAAAERIEASRSQLIDLSHRLHDQPELAFTEERASQWCADLLASSGFAVEHGIYGLPTVVRARAGAGSFRVALCAEYDALPGIGHACGHNIICASSVGAALGLAAVADAADLTVLLLGTPGEELFGLVDLPPGIAGPGKNLLLQAGAFDDVDVAMMCHPAPVDIAAPSCRALGRIRAHFSVIGAEASPILGSRRDLLASDQAVSMCQVAAMALQTRAPAGCSVHLVKSLGCWGLTAHGEKTASVDFGVWCESLDEIEHVIQELELCAHSSASITGTNVNVERLLSYAQMRHDPELARLYQANATARGRIFPDLGPLANALSFTTDMANVSLRVPAIHPFIGIGTRALNHQPEFAAACATPEADRAVIDGAIALAWTAIDGAMQPEVRDHLRKQSASP